MRGLSLALAAVVAGFPLARLPENSQPQPEARAAPRVELAQISTSTSPNLGGHAAIRFPRSTTTGTLNLTTEAGANLLTEASSIITKEH